jgi:guanosine-3',5'-bis(diphosphate) 3'-pyrophosphohydrolase
MYETLFQRIKMADFPIECRAAYAFAKYKHKQTGAVRKGSGLPYFVHPKGVALIVLENGGTIEQINAALLHDTLEDTETSSLELKKLFGEKVASMVWELTNSKTHIETLGKEEYLNEKLKMISEEALFVKLADMLYNLNDQPQEKAYIRMLKNVASVIMSRKMADNTRKLALQVFGS